MCSDQPEQRNEPGPSARGESISLEETKRAYRAFKKRLKLARLDDESRLGHRAMSSGGRSGIMAVQPPAQYPQAVWDELVRQGKLRYVGHGLYELAGGSPHT